MKNKFLVVLLFICLYFELVCGQTPAANHPVFPQLEINKALQHAFEKTRLSISAQKNIFQKSNATDVFNSLEKMFSLQGTSQRIEFNQNNLLSIDTLIVGDVPNDTVVISGAWNHTGPIWVFNDGVLIFQNATVIDTGDVYIFGNGKLFADSSSLTFPQQYFYERSLLAVQNGYVHLQDCSLNYSGMSHNLVLGDSAVVEINDLHQNDWTTCGLFGSPSLNINGCNLGGEYILYGNSNAVFNQVDTLILWHHFPDTAVINFSFPAGDTVYNYNFNNSIAGVNGVAYNVQADSCHSVMWAMMPVNGSDVTISNSVIRAIGAWFQNGDSVNVSGLFDNSSYTNFSAPLTDRNLNLINCDVQTWSLYVFDSSQIIIDSCQLGEVGCQQKASVISSQFLLDGSGGYFWATDTSFIIASVVTIYSTARSERNGIFILGYSVLPFSAPSAIGKSLILCVQNNLVQEPVPFDESVAWLENVSQPDTAVVDSIIPIIGSAWIDNGPAGGWMNFGSYSLYYQLAGAGTWNAIVLDSLTEIHNTILGNWNTQGLAAGIYFLKLTLKNNFNDSAEAIKAITLVPSFVYIEGTPVKKVDLKIIPNPSDGNFAINFYAKKTSGAKMELINLFGEKIVEKPIALTAGTNHLLFESGKITDGLYFLRIISDVFEELNLSPVKILIQQ